MIQLARSTNNGMPEYCISVVESLLNSINLSLRGTAVLIIGVAYKKNVEDTRESPFYDFKEILTKRGAKVDIYDNWVKTHNTVDTLEEGLSKATAVIIVTDHSDIIDQLRTTNFSLYQVKALFDGRNCLDPLMLSSHGIVYSGVGRR